MGGLQNCDFFICGPAAMMKNLYGGLINAGISRDSINYEYFGPKGEIEA